MYDCVDLCMIVFDVYMCCVSLVCMCFACFVYVRLYDLCMMLQYACMSLFACCMSLLPVCMILLILCMIYVCFVCMCYVCVVYVFRMIRV